MQTDTSYIKKNAEEIIEKYALTVPVHVFELADIMGIKWQTTNPERLKKIVDKKLYKKDIIQNEEDIYGYFDHVTRTIYLNDKDQPITRQRFTMAHEIGHVALHEHLKNLLQTVFLRQDIFTPRDSIEDEANYFAGYLLMPDRDIQDRLKFTVLMTSPTEVISTLAKTFAVSPEALRIRMKTFKNEYPEIWKQYNMEEKLF